MTFLAGLWAKVQIPFLIILAVMGAAAVALRQARRDGVNQVLVEQQEKRDELQNHYDEIDSSAPDLNASLDRLRKRAASPKQRP